MSKNLAMLLLHYRIIIKLLKLSGVNKISRVLQIISVISYKIINIKRNNYAWEKSFLIK